LSSCLPSVLVLSFCALLLTSGTRKSLRRFRGPFFALLVPDICPPGWVTPACFACAFRPSRVSAVVLPAGCDGCSCFCFAYSHNMLSLTSKTFALAPRVAVSTRHFPFANTELPSPRSQRSTVQFLVPIHLELSNSDNWYPPRPYHRPSLGTHQSRHLLGSTPLTPPSDPLSNSPPTLSWYPPRPYYRLSRTHPFRHLLGSTPLPQTLSQTHHQPSLGIHHSSF